jgi:hypothetical protein
MSRLARIGIVARETPEETAPSTPTRLGSAAKPAATAAPCSGVAAWLAVSCRR